MATIESFIEELNQLCQDWFAQKEKFPRKIDSLKFFQV